MIDTGFTGFLLMPLVSAFPLGLTLLGTSSYTLADGSASPKLLAQGTVTLDGQETSGVIVLETNQCGLLLGMAYLRAAKRTLIVSETHVSLLDQEFITKLVEDSTKTTETTKDKVNEIAKPAKDPAAKQPANRGPTATQN